MSPERCLLGAKINPGLKRYAEFTGPADAFKRDQHAVLPVRQHDTFFDDMTFVFPRPHGETKLQPEFAQSRHWQVTSAGLFFGESRVSLVRSYSYGSASAFGRAAQAERPRDSCGTDG